MSFCIDQVVRSFWHVNIMSYITEFAENLKNFSLRQIECFDVLQNGTNNLEMLTVYKTQSTSGIAT